MVGIKTPPKLDRATLLEMERQFDGMAQPNSLSVVSLTEKLGREKKWNQETLDYLADLGRAESAKGPNQVIMGWPSIFRLLAAGKSL